MRHKYLIILSADNEQILEIKKMFSGRFKTTDETPKKTLQLVQENGNEIAGVIIDDSLDIEEISEFLLETYETGIYKKIPMFLLFNGDNDDLYTNAVRLGIDEIIRKPYLPDVLKRRVFHITDLFNHNYRLEWLVDTQTEELKESIAVLEDMKVQVLEALGTLVEFRNMESGEHIYRVRFITDVLMHELKERYPQYGITDEIIAVTNLASILHDIGKIMISDVVLNKPGKLTNEEFEEMKLHTYYGCQILEKFEGLYNDYTYRFYYDVICYHHEKFDGGGYPEGLKGNDIPIWSQIVSLADVYDALTNERVYKKAYTHEQAKQMIYNGECGYFNPDILDCFIHVEEKVKTIAGKNRDREGRFSDQMMPVKQANILNDYEKEKAFHRAYQELVTDYFFEYDIEYGIVKNMNALDKQDEEHYVLENFPGMNKKDEEKLKKALKEASPNNPLIQLTVMIDKNGVPCPCELTLRTTWDFYTQKCIGGVGKLVFIEER